MPQSIATYGNNALQRPSNVAPLPGGSTPLRGLPSPGQSPAPVTPIRPGQAPVPVTPRPTPIRPGLPPTPPRTLPTRLPGSRPVALPPPVARPGVPVGLPPSLALGPIPFAIGGLVSDPGAAVSPLGSRLGQLFSPASQPQPAPPAPAPILPPYQGTPQGSQGQVGNIFVQRNFVVRRVSDGQVFPVVQDSGSVLVAINRPLPATPAVRVEPGRPGWRLQAGFFNGLGVFEAILTWGNQDAPAEVLGYGFFVQGNPQQNLPPAAPPVVPYPRTPSPFPDAPPLPQPAPAPYRYPRPDSPPYAPPVPGRVPRRFPDPWLDPPAVPARRPGVPAVPTPGPGIEPGIPALPGYTPATPFLPATPPGYAPDTPRVPIPPPTFPPSERDQPDAPPIAPPAPAPNPNQDPCIELRRCLPNLFRPDFGDDCDLDPVLRAIEELKKLLTERQIAKVTRKLCDGKDDRRFISGSGIKDIYDLVAESTQFLSDQLTELQICETPEEIQPLANGATAIGDEVRYVSVESKVRAVELVINGPPPSTVRLHRISNEGEYQGKFGFITTAIPSAQGGFAAVGDQAFVWSKATTLFLPRYVGIQRYVRVFLKAKCQWTLWDTGIRSNAALW